jgi:speckle-type POZ protein
LSSSAFSDLTLICGGKVFKVHKVVLCTQSEVFRKLLDGNFKVHSLTVRLFTTVAINTKMSQENGAKFVNLPDDEPRVLEVLIHYMYHFDLDTTSRPKTSGLWTFLVHVYALADKYDLPPLRSLVAQRLDDVCDPTTSIDEFVAVLRVVDACTAERTLWDIMVPNVSTNLALLLKDQSFEELVMECPSLTLPLLGMLNAQLQESALKPLFTPWGTQRTFDM